MSESAKEKHSTPTDPHALAQTPLDRLAAANAHRPKLWMCPDCYRRVRVENAPNHADKCDALRTAGAQALRSHEDERESFCAPDNPSVISDPDQAASKGEAGK